MEFVVQELVDVCGGELHRVQSDGSLIEASQSSMKREFSFSIDTRTLQPGQVFIALQGSNADGHEYLEHAIHQEACGLIVSDITKVKQVAGRRSKVAGRRSQVAGYETPFVIQVRDTLKALQAIASACRQKHSVPLAAITGSNGKTTVKDMTAAILSTRYQVLKSQKSFNNAIGLPLTLANMTEHQNIGVLEMGMNAPGEIRQLAEIAHPDVGAITNIAPAHFGFFNSLEAIMRAKFELVESLPFNGTAVLNADDELFDTMFSKVHCAVVTFGAHPPKQILGHPVIFSENLKVSQEATCSFDLHTPDEVIPIRLPIPGHHNVLNALAATAVVFALQRLDFAAIKEGLENFQSSPMRMQVTTHHDVTLLNDAYNANPTSMAAALRTLKTFPCTGKKFAVLGDMLELGQLSPTAHYDVGKLAAEVPVNTLFLLGEYAENTSQGAQAGGMENLDIVIGESHEHLAHELAKHVKQGGLILFKASRGMALEKVIEHYKEIEN